VGTFHQQENTITLTILGGEIILKEFTFTPISATTKISVTKRGKKETTISAKYVMEGAKARVIFDEVAVIGCGEVLEIVAGLFFIF